MLPDVKNADVGVNILSDQSGLQIRQTDSPETTLEFDWVVCFFFVLGMWLI